MWPEMKVIVISYLFTAASSVPLSFSYAGSQNHLDNKGSDKIQ